MDNIDSGSLGIWSEDDFVKTTAGNLGVGADADIPRQVRFLAGVAKLIRRRMGMADSDGDPERPAIFLLEARARSINPQTVPKRVPMLDNGLTTVNGRLWFVSPVVVAGKYIDLEFDDDDALFEVVTDALDLGAVPAIIYDPRTTPASVRFYPGGLSDLENRNTIDIRPELSPQLVFDVINHVYEDCLVTPDAQAKAGKLWTNNGKWWPASNAEDIIQLYLRAGLTTAFPTCTVRHEQAGVNGRLDLGFEEEIAPHSGHFVRHAVLELKVLRSFTSGGTTVGGKDTRCWIKSGIKQAYSYREEVGSRFAALCCFDMRKENTGEECFDDVRELASRLAVELKNWFIFATSQQYRDYITQSR